MSSQHEAAVLQLVAKVRSTKDQDDAATVLAKASQTILESANSAPLLDAFMGAAVVQLLHDDRARVRIRAIELLERVAIEHPRHLPRVFSPSLLPAFLNLDEEEAGGFHESDARVVQRAILALGNSFPAALNLVMGNRDAQASQYVWERCQMLQSPAVLATLLEAPHDRVRSTALKLCELLVLNYWADSFGGLGLVSFSVGQIPDGHPLLKKHNLQSAAGNVLQLMLDALCGKRVSSASSSSSSSESPRLLSLANMTVCFAGLANIVYRAPALVDRILPVMLEACATPPEHISKRHMARMSGTKTSVLMTLLENPVVEEYWEPIQRCIESIDKSLKKAAIFAVHKARKRMRQASEQGSSSAAADGPDDDVSAQRREETRIFREALSRLAPVNDAGSPEFAAMLQGFSLLPPRAVASLVVKSMDHFPRPPADPEHQLSQLFVQFLLSFNVSARHFMQAGQGVQQQTQQPSGALPAASGAAAQVSQKRRKLTEVPAVTVPKLSTEQRAQMSQTCFAHILSPETEDTVGHAGGQNLRAAVLSKLAAAHSAAARNELIAAGPEALMAAMGGRGGMGGVADENGEIDLGIEAGYAVPNDEDGEDAEMEAAGDEGDEQGGSSDYFRSALVAYLRQDFESRYDVAMSWLYHLAALLHLEIEQVPEGALIDGAPKSSLKADDEDNDEDMKPADADEEKVLHYSPLYNEVVAELLDAVGDDLITRFTLDLPMITGAVIERLRTFCSQAPRRVLGLSTLRDLILYSLPARQVAFEVLLEYTRDQSTELREDAIRLVTNQLHPKSFLKDDVRDFAVASLNVLLEEWTDPDAPPEVGEPEQLRLEKEALRLKIQMMERERELRAKKEGKAAAAAATKDDDGRDAQLREIKEAREVAEQRRLERQLADREQRQAAVTEQAAKARYTAHIKRHLALAYALCTREPALLSEVQSVFAGASTTVKEVMIGLVRDVINTIGADSKDLAAQIKLCPAGAEVFAIQCLHLSARGRTPSRELVAAGMSLYQSRNKDARFLVPVLSGMSLTQIHDVMPSVFKLENEKERTLALNKILEARVLPPDDLLVMLHRFSKTKEELLGASRVALLCFKNSTVFNHTILSRALNKLSGMRPLPKLFMLTVIRSISAWDNLRPWVVDIMRPIITSPLLWKDKDLWTGFITYCERAMPECFDLLILLDRRQLQDVLDKAKNKDLRRKFEAHLKKMLKRRQIRREMLYRIGFGHLRG